MKILCKYKVALIKNAILELKTRLIFLGEFFNTVFETNNLKKNAEDFSDKNSRGTYVKRQLSEELEIMIICGLQENSCRQNFQWCFANQQWKNNRLIYSIRNQSLF
ncbi:unnamed protein product [Paramecium sonneborni]|uniref:Uncharacterized protein n=1 Tax=Paramecium sonneborni TaxID=65129 RepID=A0A8S1QWA5_9CILI|nr:unnamed protein product [Paramecium sonneborni]